MTGKTYIFKVKESNATALFTYTLKGNLMEFKAEGDWTLKGYQYLMETLPKKEEEIKPLAKQGKDFYDLTEIPTNFSFDRFWQEYGKIGTKVLAQKKYERLKETEKIQALQYIATLKKQKQKEGTAMPYAETYLNQKRWES